MPIPTWAVGQVLTASDVNTWFVPLNIVKPADTTRTGTTPSDDPDLILAVAANATYVFTAYLRYQGSIISNSWKLTWAVPASTIMRYCPGVFVDASGATVFDLNYAGADTVLINSNALGQALNISGTITTAGTAGNVKMQWSFNTGGGNMTIQQYSWLSLQRVA